MKKGASNAPFFQSVNCLSAGKVDGGLLPPEKVEGEVVDEPPVEIFVHVAEAVALAGEDEHVEAFARPDERIDDAEGVGRVDVVVDVAVHEEQVALEARGYLGVGGDFVGKSGVALLGDDFLDAVVGLAPPAVVDAVIVVAGAGDGGLEEVGILEHGRRGHESTAGMAVYADAGDVDVSRTLHCRDCYRYQCYKSAAAVALKMGREKRYRVAFQSRFGNGKWLAPTLSDTLRECLACGSSKVAVCAPSFTADCLETLNEIDVEEREVFEREGGKMSYHPCLNDNDSWCLSVKNMITDWLKQN